MQLVALCVLVSVQAGAGFVTPKSGWQARTVVSTISHGSRPLMQQVAGVDKKTYELPKYELPESMLSGMQGKALNIRKEDYPTLAEVRNVIPKHCFKKDTTKSLIYAATSLTLTLICGILGYEIIPMELYALPAWLLYAAVTGTVAMGCWVQAHECGHNAFSDDRKLQDAVGYFFHSALLVPYFSWQRSHAVHHSRTNHATEGETHVPAQINGPDSEGQELLNTKEEMGSDAFAILTLFQHFLIGWPAYLLVGATGGPVRGVTNHFWPTAPFSDALWPNKWPKKVLQSDIGILVTLAGLYAWSAHSGFWEVAALYGGPYLVVNAWLILYTWLQHTDTDVPHYEGEEWSFIRGAFLTIDRPYGPVFDFLHHRIGSTHVAHHIESSIPFYHAKEATEAIKAAYPHLYLYEPTPLPEAVWRVATKCVAVEKQEHNGEVGYWYKEAN